MYKYIYYGNNCTVDTIRPERKDAYAGKVPRK